MILYPAIDIRGGRAVRLTRGEFERETVYQQDPLAAASQWVREGATHLHVVDLDGARDGLPANLRHLHRIVSELPVRVQFGGGLRSLGAVREVLEIGVDRVILGTAAFSEEGLLEEALRDWPSSVLVSVDVRGGRVATHGWRESIDAPVGDVIAELAQRGVSRFVYTDVDRDGMLLGPDVEAVRHLAQMVQGSFVYSGGIGQLRDLQALAELRAPALEGVIVGKALYERRFTVAEALDALPG